MEVEIKLHVLPTVKGGPTAFFDRLAELQGLAGYPLGPAEQITIRDVYYDTSDGRLAASGTGLRLRVENGAALVTLKISRHREGSLTSREEYEHALSAQSLNQVLERIRPLIGPDQVPLDDFAAGHPAGPLLPALDVVTHRVARSVGDLGSLTLDRVEYPGVAPTPFFDLEMEAANGLQGEKGLRLVERELHRIASGHLAPSAESKLERGLRLQRGVPPLP